MARSPHLDRSFNHGQLQARGDWAGQFRRIEQPVLVIHGAEDPILPVRNGEALAAGVAGARLVVLPGVGHEVPPRASAPIVDAIALQVRPRPAE